MFERWVKIMVTALGASHPTTVDRERETDTETKKERADRHNVREREREN